MTAPERFADSQIPLAPRASSIHDPSETCAALDFAVHIGHRGPFRSGHFSVLMMEVECRTSWFSRAGTAMRRRDFMKIFGGAAAAWPLAARAQQRDRMRRIGVLMNLTADDPDGPPRITAFAQGLQESGWAVGRNVRIDYRWSADIMERGRMAAELVALAP